MGTPDVTGAEVLTTKGPAGTRALGRRLAKRLAPGDCVALTGPLGAGKTVLVRGIAEGLGIGDARLVSSPSYVLVHEYPADVAVYHVDLYRTVRPAAELADLGVEEMLADGVVVIEWADRAGGALPRPRWEIDIEMTGERERRFAVRRVE
jgi:tRNA threonylcarbamoyladenosine biosynthesis protein TsaE